MSEDRRGSGGGALFMGLVFIGFVAMFWWVILAVLGVALLAGVVWYVSRCLDARDAARLAIAARADEQHALVLAGDDRGIYGEYTPKQID
jgi:hypothetical protein